jgi:hypothetical protein
MRCARCEREAPADQVRCPGCGAVLGGGGLARGGALDRALDQHLARLTAEAVMQREEALTGIALESAVAAPLELSALEGAIELRAQEAMPSLDELEGMLARDAPATLDGLHLGRLLADGGGDRETLRKGLIFLRRRRYESAVEWWSLNRQGLPPGRERFDLVLLVMEGFTHRLAGNQREAARVQATRCTQGPGRRAERYSSIGSKSLLSAPQSGHTQVSGRSSNRVPGGTPADGSPSAGS